MTGTQGDLLAEMAVEDVATNTDSRWLAEATRILHDLIRAGRPFTTDDIWAELDEREVPAPREPRAMGAVTRPASRDHRIVKTGEWINSNRPGCHSRPVPVWRANT